MSESLDEKGMAEYLQQQVFSPGPKSVGEALAQGEGEPEPEPPAEPTETGGEDRPVVVEDVPPPRREEPETPPAPETPPSPDEEPPEGEEPEVEEPEAQEDEHVVWATRKYGTDPEKWAKAAYDQERYINRLGQEKREAEEIAQQWAEYAQSLESQPQTLAAGMPLSAQEEAWVEQAMGNPLEYARAAAHRGNVQLYNAVLQRVGEENPMLAVQVGTAVQNELVELARAEQAEENGRQAPNFQEALGQSFGRVGIDLQAYGPRMSEKIAELGEYHPYVQAILGGDDHARDLAVQAVYDLVRASSLTTRQTQRSQAVERENELRRDVASVQTGGIAPSPPPPTRPPIIDAMQKEWERAGQWSTEEVAS